MNRLTLFLLPILVMSHPGARAAVIADQIGDPNAYNFGATVEPHASQIFTFVDDEKFNSMVLDDFTVTAGQLHLGSVSALFEAPAGVGVFSMVDGYQVSIFSDPTLAGSSLLGDVVERFIDLPGAIQFTSVGSGSTHVLVDLDFDVVLPAAGTYWLGIAPKSSRAETDQFYVNNSGATGVIVPGNDNGYFVNPGQGYMRGQAVEPTSLNFAYMVTMIPEPLTPSLLALGGLFLLRRQRRRPQASGPF